MLLQLHLLNLPPNGIKDLNNLTKDKREEAEPLDESQSRASILTASPGAVIRWWERCDKQKCGRVEACTSASAASCVKSVLWNKAQKPIHSSDLADNDFEFLCRSEKAKQVLLLKESATYHFPSMLGGLSKNVGIQLTQESTPNVLTYVIKMFCHFLTLVSAVFRNSNCTKINSV